MGSRANVWFFDLDRTLLMPSKTSTGISFEDTHRAAGLTDRTDALFEKYHDQIGMFEWWLREGAALYEGIKVQDLLERVVEGLSIRPGARELVAHIKEHNPCAKVGIISGGLYNVAKYVADLLELDFCHANRFVQEGGYFTGEAQYLVGDKVPLAERELGGTDWELTSHIGDAQNDVTLWQRVGHAYGIGTNGNFAGVLTASFECFHNFREYLEKTRK